MEKDDLTFIIGLSAGVCTALSLLPQLIKMVRDKKANDISLFYLLILFTGLSLWIWYGFQRTDLPVIVTNIVALLLNTVIILLGIRYKRKASSR